MARKRDSEQSARDIDRRKYMTRTEAAIALGVGQGAVLPMWKQGRLRGIQRGKWLYIERESVEDFKRKRGF